jgi:ketosteroid isomerase-like protein
MKYSKMLLLSPTIALLFASPASLAQDTSQDEADVWSVIENVWNADENGDREWPENLLADEFSGWSKNSPVPRSKSSIKMWDRFNEQLGKMVAHELYPYHIIVSGDTAVAHYLYSSAYKLKDGKIEMNSGRYSDILIRTDDGWKFLAWHGGDDD